MTIYDYIIIILSIIIIFLLAYIYFSRSNRQKDVSYIESIIDSNFSDLLESNEVFQTSYLKDINFLQRKIKELENKINKIENYKQVDLQVNDDKGQTKLIEIKEHANKNKRASKLYKQSESKFVQREQGKSLIDSYVAPVEQLDSNRINDQVINLYKEGFSMEEISKELQVMLGEIQLILALAKRQNII